MQEQHHVEGNLDHNFSEIIL